MTKQHFTEIARALYALQEDEIPRLGDMKWRMFRAGPVAFLMMADDTDAQAIWDALPARLRI